MDLSYSPEEERFRAELRTWLAENPAGSEPEGLDDWVRYGKAWQRRLHAAGWCGIAWPQAYGGRGATLVEQVIFQEEMARAKSPLLINLAGLTMGGPVLIAHGTEEQKRRHLQPILSADEIWCQGFSEPNAGSDLAALKTRAELDGDDFVINGQKVWTSFARYADWCMLLVRTDPEAPKHEGITFLLVDMHSPGIALAARWQVNGVAATRDPLIRQHLAQAIIESSGIRYTAYRSLTKALRGGTPGPEGSIEKLFWSEMYQRMLEDGLAIQGPYGQLTKGSRHVPDEGIWPHLMLYSRGRTIAAGSSEIQRNIIAERVLGLPRGKS
jgi:alkylation response protein AidB-like acyl-CoA dehydrogenase